MKAGKGTLAAIIEEPLWTARKGKHPPFHKVWNNDNVQHGFTTANKRCMMRQWY